jgi:Lon protease-like protein
MNCTRLARAAAIAGVLLSPCPLGAQPATPDAQTSAPALPAAIPIFPLPDVSLFPKISRPLHIFETRYRAMVADALKGDRIIGMVMLRPGYEADYDGRPPIHPIGCAGVITDAVQLPDGRYNIVLRGLVKFRVASEDQSGAYRVARVEAMPETESDEDVAALRTMRQRLEALLASLAPGSDTPPPEISDEEVVNTMAQYLDLDPADRQQLLEREGALSRARGLVELAGAAGSQR